MKHWYLVILVVILDLFFLYGFGKIYALEFQSESVQLAKINSLLETSVGAFTQSEDPAALQLGVEEYEAAFAAVKRSVAKVLAYLLLFWTLFQGCIWFFCHMMAGKKQKFIPFFIRFAIISIGGFVLFLGIIAIVTWLSFAVFSSPLPIIGQTGINIITGALALILLYLLSAAYAALDWKKFVNIAFKKFLTSASYYVAIIIALGITYALMGFFAAQSIGWSFVYAIVVALPLTAYARVFWIEKVT